MTITIDLPGVREVDYNRTREILQEVLSDPARLNREAIHKAFAFILSQSPGANPSDLWHHVVYRLYQDVFGHYRAADPKQSWARSSGDALELFLENWYNPLLAPHGLTLKALMSKNSKTETLASLGLPTRLSVYKLDMALKVRAEDEWRIAGGVHVKASLAERVSDDVPCSRALVERGYWSPLWTMDVKSFPPPGGSLINRGEFGTSDKPSEKRNYIEADGEFDNCYSANLRTIPSGELTPSGKKIIRIDLNNQPDAFVQDALAWVQDHRVER